MDNRPIGIFDSGLGGLTVLAEILKVLPDEELIYFGDTLRFPYGPKNKQDVRNFSFKIADFLCQQDVKVIVVACNTATASALNDLKQSYDIPVIGVIKPGARTAVSATENNRIGVIATEGTVASGAYEKAAKEIRQDIKVYSNPAPALVEYVEKGIFSGKGLEKTIDSYLSPLLGNGIDALILGCTHFPLIQDVIGKQAGKVIVINSAVETAKDLKGILEEKGLLSSVRQSPKRIFFETGNKSRFLELGRLFLGKEIEEVKRIDLNI